MYAFPYVALFVLSYDSLIELRQVSENIPIN